MHDFSHKINRLLTEGEGRTGKYWPEVVAVRTERSPGYLYGTRLLIVKSTSGGLHLKGFRHDVFFMTRGTQTKASYHEFEKQFTHVKSP